ncbi:MAG: shikimate kinase [Clostridia bacterium]|nr:shikimate kinase [Clostridia bacterium]
MNNIILIGMPASGKSTVGVILAKVTGRDFVDTDLLIQKKTGRRLPEIIEARGVDGFLAVENDVCASLDAENAVIATGGSAVYGREGMANLKRLGTVVYLAVGREQLRRRLRDIRGRGVVLRDGQSLDDLFDEREPLYEKYADVTVRETGGTIEDTVAAVVKAQGALTNK